MRVAKPYLTDLSARKVLFSKHSRNHPFGHFRNDAVIGRFTVNALQFGMQRTGCGKLFLGSVDKSLAAFFGKAVFGAVGGKTFGVEKATEVDNLIRNLGTV